MATSVYKFLSWANATQAGGVFGDYYGTVQVKWSYDQSAKKITIEGIEYNNDLYWSVGAAMRMVIRWSDGTETELANGTYNYRNGDLITKARAAGFVTIGNVLGIFSVANHRVDHRFSADYDSGGFSVYFGSTLGTINYGNPASYRELTRTSGPEPSVTFNTPPKIDHNKLWATNPDVYKLSSGISGGIDWGVGATSYSISAVVSYTIDGNDVSYTAFTSTSKQGTYEFTVNGLTEQLPWNKVPDGETVTVKWTVSTNIGSDAGQVTQYCQPSYTAYVIEQNVNGGAPVEADLIVSNAIGSVPNKLIRRIDMIS